MSDEWPIPAFIPHGDSLPPAILPVLDTLLLLRRRTSCSSLPLPLSLSPPTHMYAEAIGDCLLVAAAVIALAGGGQ